MRPPPLPLILLLIAASFTILPLYVSFRHLLYQSPCTTTAETLMQAGAPILQNRGGEGAEDVGVGVGVVPPNPLHNVSLTKLTGGNIPHELEDVRSAFLSRISDPSAAAVGGIDAAYFHMLQIRAGANFHPFGTTGVFHSQWQTMYWKAREKFIRGEVKTICEAGLGSGHSGIVLLTATTNTRWYDDGAQFHSFDNGLKNEPHKKVAAYNYMTSTFGGRVTFHFGPQSSVEVDKVKAANPEFVCDIVHIDADHKMEGVMKDIDAMHKVSHKSTILLMDDYNIKGIKNAVERKGDKIMIDTIYSQEGMTDWMIQSAEKKRPSKMEKIYVVGHFIHAG